MTRAAIGIRREIRALAFALGNVMRNHERGMPGIDGRVLPSRASDEDAENDAGAGEMHGSAIASLAPLASADSNSGRFCIDLLQGAGEARRVRL